MDRPNHVRSRQALINKALFRKDTIMMTENKNGIFILSSGDTEQPYRYAVGKEGSKFLHTLAEAERIIGVKCEKCDQVFVPPRKVCGPCFHPMTKYVDLPNEGEIYAYTILRFTFLDPETGVKKPVPYGYGLVRLDGADTSFQHFIDVAGKEDKIKIGARVRAVFNKTKERTLRDVKHFELVD